MKILLASLAVVWVAGCSVTPPVVDTVADEATQARQALAIGNFAEAARLWQEAAVVSVGPKQQDYRLRAAEAWWQAGEDEQTRSQLAQVDDLQLASEGLARYGLLSAELALSSADASAAEFYLAVAAKNLIPGLQPRYRDLLQRTQRLQADPASYALATAGTALKSTPGYDVIQGVAILQLLEDVPSGRLESMSSETAESYGMAGWPELTVLIRKTLINRVPLDEAAADWVTRFPVHEVSETGFIELADQYRQWFAPPRNVAVLLPTEGGLASAGRAIRDGLVSAYLDRPDNVQLRFYSTNSDPQSAVSAYYSALRDGAQWIIGPLRRQSVQALAELGGLGLPVLALNDFSKENPAGATTDLVYSLSLSQEQEARAVARTALDNGISSAIMMTSNDAWGLRMEAAFADEFIKGGGVIKANAQFEPGESDHSALLTELLKIDESEDRKNRVQATLGISLNFEPSRRDDFELIFLAANPGQGRQIRPQLRFHDAGDVPVFTTGRIYAGENDPAANQDLNGVYFPSTKFQIFTNPNENVSELASLRGGSLASLNALGQDAWNVLPWLPLMQKDNDLRFSGSVGDLSMNAAGNLVREPVWAQFSRGRPVPVTWDSTDR